MAKQMNNEKSDLVTLIEIKHLIEKSALSMQQDDVEKISRIHLDIRDLGDRFDELKEFVIGIKKKGESPKKVKTKRHILDLLKKHKKLGPTQLAKLINLSRVRANEYLVELEREKIVKGTKIGRNRYYTLNTDIQKSIGDIKNNLMEDSL